MLFELNSNEFTLHERLEDMKVNESTTMKDIYSLYRIYKQDPKQLFDSKLQFFDCSNDFFSFELNGKYGYWMLDEPIEIKINKTLISLVCNTQINFIKNKYNVDIIYCNDDDSCIFISAANLLLHKGHNYEIISSYEYNIFQNEEDINKFMKKYEQSFIEQLFNTPIDFEKNYKYYFNMNDKQILSSQFYIYEDSKTSDRQKIVSNILNLEFDRCYNFYGSSGQGKSITLIGALKYGKKNKMYGTFYINCKTLRVLYRRCELETMKKILIDEIVFLLRSSYKYYKQCCEIVKNFVFKNEFDFWRLIKDIFELIVEIPDLKYIIGIDQYNSENDINSELKKIKLTFLSKNKFRIVVFSSMNESDIRMKKINNLLLGSKCNDTMELKKICSEFFTNFNEEETEIFNLFGKKMKVFNEINQIKNKLVLVSLDEYFKEKKNKIKFKWFCFYQEPDKRKELFFDNNAKYDFSDCIGKILGFIPNEEYTKEDMEKIIKYIPFRFFDIEKHNSGYIAKYSFPIIEQILIEIYKEIIFKNAYESIKLIIGDSGALGCIFEYAVTNYIKKKSQNKDNNLIFNCFKISKNLSVKKFVMKNNEKTDKLIFKVKDLEKGNVYLIEQEIFGGKTLDFIIIDFTNSNPTVFGFQVSIYKKIIYEISELQKSYLSMKFLLLKYFGINFDEKNLYFGYIFNFDNIKDSKYKLMLEKCEEQSLKYCFFDPKQSQFCDKNGQEINDINDIVSKVFVDIPVKQIKNLDSFVYNTVKYEDENNEIIYLNNRQSKVLTSLVKQIYGPQFDWKCNQKSTIETFSKYYYSKSKYFYIVYNFPTFKVVFPNPHKIYSLLFYGDIKEETMIDFKNGIYLCEVIDDKK